MPKVSRNLITPLVLLLVLFPLTSIHSQTTNAAPVPVSSATEDAMNRGNEAGSHGDLDAAVAAFSEAIKADPTLAAAYTKRGTALAWQHKLTEAIADFDHALQLDPKAPEAWYQRGSAKGEKGDFDGALSDLNHAIEFSPTYGMAFYNRGHVRYFKSDLKGALDDLNQAVTLKTKQAPITWMRGVVELAQLDSVSALADFKESVKTGFAYGALWQWIAQKHANDLSADTTLELASQNTQLFKADDWPTPVALFFLQKITQDQLLAKAREGSDSTPRLCEAWFYIGMSHRFQGDLKSARSDFQQAIATGSTQSEELVEAQRALAQLPPE